MNDTSTKTPSADLPGDAAAQYDQFFGPLFFEPYAIEITKRIDPAPGSIVLEIAAGTGRVTRHIRERIAPSVKLTSMNDEAVITPLVEDAGFSKIAIEKVGLFSVSPTAKEAAFALVRGGIYEEIKKRNLPG